MPKALLIISVRLEAGSPPSLTLLRTESTPSFSTIPPRTPPPLTYGGTWRDPVLLLERGTRWPSVSAWTGGITLERDSIPFRIPVMLTGAVSVLSRPDWICIDELVRERQTRSTSKAIRPSSPFSGCLSLRTRPRIYRSPHSTTL